VVEDDRSLRRLTQIQLDKLGYQTTVAVDVPAALEILRQESPDLVICDLHLPGPCGLDLLKNVRAEHPETKFVMVTAYGSISTAVEAMKLGAYDYLTKPVHPVELRILVERVFEQQRLREEVHSLRRTVDQKFGFETLIGNSKVLASVIDVAARAARTDAPVLITGETGTGKEVLAKAIHFNSLRHDRPFVIVNCGAIPRELIESELFGHVKGAFTGAVVHKKGKAEMADAGTLFLDEIGDMPLEMQIRLLRLIQQGEIQKVGAPNTINVDVRVIAATNRKLEQLVESGTFREDLYYRLLVVPIEIPPLRKRPEDIPDLVRHFFKESKEKHHREYLRLPESLMGYFAQYQWPGNVRQLANCLVRLVVLAAGEEITVSDLPDFLRNPQPEAAVGLTPQVSASDTENVTLDAVERKTILEALEKFKWNQTRAARYLGVTRKILRGRLAKYGIRPQPAPSKSQKATSV
jgi:DNA-binding NtrC family response regulator